MEKVLKTVVPYKFEAEHFWYSNRLNERFEVVYETNSTYAVKDNEYTRFIVKDDAYELIPSSEFKESSTHKDLGFGQLLKDEIRNKFQGEAEEFVFGNKFEPDSEELCKTFDTSTPTMDNYILPEGLNSMRDRLEYIKTIHGIPDGGVFDAFFRDAVVNAYRVSKVESTMHPKKIISANEYFNEEYGKD